MRKKRVPWGSCIMGGDSSDVFTIQEIFFAYL